MRISLPQLEAFYWVARLGGFRAASGHLHLTQPAISVRVMELEQTLGVKLFDRDKYRAPLTLAGRDALADAERMLHLADDFEKIGQRRDPLRGLLRLGANESSAMFGLTQLLTSLKTDHPGRQIALTIDIGAALSRKLNARELDLAILTDPISAPHVIDEPLGKVELVWVASTCRVLDRSRLTPMGMAVLPVVLMPPPSTLHNVAMTWFRGAGVTMENFECCNSMSLIIQMVTANHAISLLPLSIVQAEIDDGRIQVLPAKPAVAPRCYFMSYLRDARGCDGIAGMARVALSQSGLLMTGT